MDRERARPTLCAQRLCRHHRGAGSQDRCDALLPERAPTLSSSPIAALVARAGRPLGQRRQPEGGRTSGSAPGAGMNRPTSRALIRTVDLGFALLLAPVWLPLLLLGLAAAASQGLPIFYRAARIGRDGKTFRMLKLRTMVPNAAQLGPAVSASDDPRITAV